MKRLRLYGFDGCPYCQDLKKMFEDEGLEYVYVDVNKDENEAETEKIFELGKTESVPVVLVNNTLLSPEHSFNSLEDALELVKKFLNE